MKKRILAIWGVCLFFLTICGCGGSTESSPPVEIPSSSSSQSESSEVISNSTPPSKISSSTPESQIESSSSSRGIDPATSINSIIALMDPILSENYDGHEIYYEDGILVINLWSNGTAEAVSYVQAGLIGMDVWEQVRSSMVYMASSSRTLVDTIGRDDVDIMTNLLNDLDHELVIISLLNDKIVYDAVLE